MEKTINTHQAGLILIIFTVALKLSVLPALINDYSAISAYITCLFALTIDFICTLIIILIMRKMPNKNFFELVCETFSKPVGIILFIILSLYFILKSIIALLELHDYYITALFEEINPIFFLTVLSFLLVYLFNRSFRNLGRTFGVFFWPLLIGLLFTLIYPISDIQLTNILPIFADGMYPIWNGVLHTSIGFGDFMIMLLLMGHIEYTPKTTKKLIIYLSCSMAFIFLFYICFQGSFGTTAVGQTLALSDLPLHNPYPANIGKLEWLTILIWTIILLAEATLLGKCASKCLGFVFNCSNTKIPAIVSSSIIVNLIGITYLKLYNYIEFAIGSWFSIFIFIFHIVLVLLAIVAYIIWNKKEKLREKNLQ